MLEQADIINEIKNDVDEWERSLKSCILKREDVMRNAQFLKLHLIHLMREQTVLDAFEPIETTKSETILKLQEKVFPHIFNPTMFF
jgi:hypothetical protein